MTAQGLLIPRPDLIEIVGMYQGVACRFTVWGEPVSKARARFTRHGGTYTPEKTRNAEEAIAWQFKSSGGILEPSTEIAFGVIAVFHGSTRQRRDVDNMLKLVLDGLNKVAWVDDTQVLEVAGRKCFVTKEMARTEVIVYRLGAFPRKQEACSECGSMFNTYDSLRGKVHYCSQGCRIKAQAEARKRVCPQCGNGFDTPKQQTPQVYCSVACKAAGGRVDGPCSVCGTVFNYRKHNVGRAVYCSDECRRKHGADVARENRTKRYPGTCTQCGAGVTKKAYLRCRKCHLSGAEVTL